MNKKNETYSNLNMNINISESNNKYHSPLNHNYTYYTLNTSLLNKTKNQLYANLKKNFTPNYLGPNYIYNEKKVISLHKNIEYNKNKKLKNLKLGKSPNKLNLVHRNELRNKLLQSNIYKIIEKTANDNYLKAKRKKNMFITTIEDDYESDEEENNQIGKFFNKKKSNRKLKLNINPSLDSNKSENKKNKIYLNSDNNNNNHILTYNQTKKKRNKSLNIYDLTDISLPCITFNNSLNSLSINNNHKNSLSQTCLAKLRIEVINKVLHENYKTYFEKRDFPLSLSDTKFRSQLKNQKYFHLFDELTKKYLLFLTNEFSNNIIILAKLIKQKEDLVKINENKLKKISALQEKIKIYEAFNDLYLNLKNKVTGKNVTQSPRKSILKTKKTTRLTAEFFKKGSIFKKGNELFPKRISHMKTIIVPNKNSLLRQSKAVTQSPKKAKELFKNTQEIQEIFEEREKKVFGVYKKYSELIYNMSLLSLENKKEKDKAKENKKKNSQIIDNNITIEKFQNELILLKLRNKELINYKNALKKSKINDEYNAMNKKERQKMKESKVLKKLKEIIFYHKINTDKIPGMKKIFKILQEKEYNDCIIYKGKTFSKEIFYLKILEFMFLKILEYKNKCLSDKNMREKYIKIKAEREKEMKYIKCEQNLKEENFNIMKKNIEIINKNNKIIVLRNKKFDPFYKRYFHDEIIKKRMKSKEDDRTKQDDENEKYNNYLIY